MAIEVEVYNSSGIRRLPEKKIRGTAERTLRGEKISNALIRIIYLNDDEITKLNKEYLNHDYSTDVLSFQLGEDEIEGEIYIGVETARQQAKDCKVSLTNELMRLTSHGCLHLIGYDDKTEKQRQAMKELEDKYIDSYE